jgi:hypothetical protein
MKFPNPREHNDAVRVMSFLAAEIENSPIEAIDNEFDMFRSATVTAFRSRGLDLSPMLRCCNTSIAVGCVRRVAAIC